MNLVTKLESHIAFMVKGYLTTLVCLPRTYLGDPLNSLQLHTSTF